MDTAQPEIHLFYSTYFSSLSWPGAYFTHNATNRLSDITGDNLSDYMQLPLEPHNALLYLKGYSSARLMRGLTHRDTK